MRGANVEMIETDEETGPFGRIPLEDAGGEYIVIEVDLDEIFDGVEWR